MTYVKLPLSIFKVNWEFAYNRKVELHHGTNIKLENYLFINFTPQSTIMKTSWLIQANAYLKNFEQLIKRSIKNTN